MQKKVKYIDFKIISNVLGSLIGVVGLMMLVPSFVSLGYGGEDFFPLFVSATLSISLGLFMRYGVGDIRNSNNVRFSRREGYIIVSSSWFVVSVIGCLPFVFYGGEELHSFTDAFFEIVSGFTTTGLTLLEDIETMPRGLIFWRCMTNWIGGIGIIVFILSIIPMMGGSLGTNNLYSAEISGPTKDKIHSKTSTTAKILINIYIGLTVIQTLFLLLGDMDIYDALCHSFATVGTGGFSTRNNSLMDFSIYSQNVITIFMFLSGINYGLYYFLLRGRFDKLRRNSELKAYILFTIVIVILLAVFLFLHNEYSNIEESIRNSAFMAISCITTTGFLNTDYTSWLFAADLVLLMLFFTGACSGSSTGSMKISRYVIMFKNTFAEFRRAMHPRAIISVKYNNGVVMPDIIFRVLAFFFIYIMIVMLAALIFSGAGYKFVFSLSVSASAIGNIGLIIDPSNNYILEALPIWSKYFLSLLMILGRLELFTVLILFTPAFWKK